MIAGPRAADMELRLDFKINIYSQLGKKGKPYRVLGSKFEVLSSRFSLALRGCCGGLLAHGVEH